MSAEDLIEMVIDLFEDQPEPFLRSLPALLRGGDQPDLLWGGGERWDPPALLRGGDPRATFPVPSYQPDEESRVWGVNSFAEMPAHRGEHNETAGEQIGYRAPSTQQCGRVSGLPLRAAKWRSWCRGPAARPGRSDVLAWWCRAYVSRSEGKLPLLRECLLVGVMSMVRFAGCGQAGFRPRDAVCRSARCGVRAFQEWMPCVPPPPASSLPFGAWPFFRQASPTAPRLFSRPPSSVSFRTPW